jgi:hypothetical protein
MKKLKDKTLFLTLFENHEPSLDFKLHPLTFDLPS